MVPAGGGGLSWVPLWVKTNASFLEGASHPEELVVKAIAHGLPAMAITDRDGVYGVVRAHVAAKEHGLRLIYGAELRPSVNDVRHPVVLLAESREGWASLCKLISAGQRRGEKGEAIVDIEEVAGAAGRLVALCPDAEALAPLREAYGRNLYALCARHREAGDLEHEARLREAAAMLDVPTVAGIEVLYHDRARRPLADVLTCIRHCVTLSQAGTRIRSNDEHALPSTDEMLERFADDPAAVVRTLEIADRCRFSLDDIRYRYPAERIPVREGAGAPRTVMDWLEELTLRGATGRYGDPVPEPVRAQIARELELIRDLDYGGYFLTMHEIVRYCREKNILCQGRGSAANSAVCYCLGITAIDPVRMDLLFERFLSRERAEPPDIDLDIEHDRREEVIQHVYEKYGRRHAAMVANVIRYRARSAVRDVGKALGLPQTDLDGVARLLGHYASTLDTDVFAAAGLDVSAPATQHLLRLCVEILDFPRHLSIHPGGFLLGHEPVDTIVPIEPATMENRTVIQWDKQDIEDLLLFKVDLLGLGTLTAIHGSFDLLSEHEGLDLEIATVPPEDPATYEMVSRGDTVGVFQIESRAQMAMLPRLRPRTFYDLVIEVAIVRPGPIQGDMVHPYLRRRQAKEPVTLPHPALASVLEKTLGVPIFQEQVMKLAILVADYTPGEADRLRRDMGAWRARGRLDEHRDKLTTRMTARGIPLEFAERVVSQIQGFGEYGFPESHAASFALLAYVTAWLKCHHPAVFTCAMLNAQPMGFYSPSTLVEDVKRHGVRVLPICVQKSAWDCTLEPDETGRASRWALRMGLRYVKGLGERERERFLAAPSPYADVDDFVRRTRLNRRALTQLAEAGALDGLGVSRRDAIWRVRSLVGHVGDSLPSAPRETRTGFRALSDDDEIAWDYRASQHSARGHPMLRYRPLLEARRIPCANEVWGQPDGKRLDYVGMVICRQRPGTATGVTFFTLEDETGFVNLVVWRDVFERYAVIGKTASPLGVTGKLQVAEGVTHLVAESLWVPDLADTQHPRPAARDFR